MNKLNLVIDQILMKYPHTRDSDNELIIGVLQTRGAALTPEQRDIIRTTNFESITRYRRKLQEEGKFMPSPEVAAKRRLKSYVVQQNAPSADAETLHGLVVDI